MRFRTEYIPKVSDVRISHSDCILMLGSCFTDNIGERLLHSGFQVLANPFGPLFNPVSIERLLSEPPSLFVEYDERIHCLDLPSRYQSDPTGKEELTARILDEYAEFKKFRDCATVAVITLGSAFVYNHLASGRIVANCHKLPAPEFNRSLLTLGECTRCIENITASLKACGVKIIIFTISPVHHLDNGLEGNFLNKATLRMAVESVLDDNVSYFPAFEIMNDDLRDYRFYSADMRHPSDVAVEYIYSKFEDCFFNRTTREEASRYCKEWQRGQHVQLLNQ